MSTEELKLAIDVDVIIDKYNKENPDLRQITRKSLAEDLDINVQLFTNWKGGKVPKSILVLLKLMEISSCELKDFVKAI